MKKLAFFHTTGAPTRATGLYCLHLQPAAQLRVADAVLPHVPHRHAAHRPDAAVVERAQLPPQPLSEEPALRAVQ